MRLDIHPEAARETVEAALFYKSRDADVTAGSARKSMPLWSARVRSR